VNKKILLADLVPKNLVRLRRDFKLTQEDLAGPLEMQRANVSRKEAGKNKITLNQLDNLMEKFDLITLRGLLYGHPDMAPSDIGLSKEAQAEFPVIKQVIMMANDIAGSTDVKPEDLKMMATTLDYAKNKVVSVLGEPMGPAKYRSRATD